MVVGAYAFMSLPMIAAVLLAQATGQRDSVPNVPSEEEPRSVTRSLSEELIAIAIALGEYDRDYVDAYFGPERLRTDVRSRKWTLDEIDRRAEDALVRLATEPTSPEPWSSLRLQFDRRNLEALRTRVAMLKGRRFKFDEQSAGLFDAVAPVRPEEHFRALVAKLEQRFPGTGPIATRYAKWREQFIVPRERLNAVFTAAVAECRARTLKHLDLPPSETFSVEYVTGKSWSAYNWYQGNFRSVIQINTDLPIYIDRAIQLACHEGYPGHHVYSTLLEKNLVRDRGWAEFTLEPLFSPRALIAEGTADFGVELAFPGSERVEFERRVLFPLAGLEPERAAEYYEVYAVVAALAYSEIESARQYIDGGMDREAAVRWLERYALMSRARAEQRVRFFDQYGSYVLNYTIGRDLVRAYVANGSGTPPDPQRRWTEFGALLSLPRIPSALRSGLAAGRRDSGPATTGP